MPGTARCAPPSSGPTSCSTDDEQRLFRYLSVFVDGIALDDAERLATDLGLAGDPGTVLARLVDASMLDAEFTEGGTRYRMLETLRAFGLDRLAAEGDDGDGADRLLRLGGRPAPAGSARPLPTEREPEADAACAARWRTCGRRGGWRATAATSTTAAAMIIALFDAISYRDLIEIRDWAEELARFDTARARAHPRAAAVLGTAAEAAYHRGDYARPTSSARAGPRPRDRRGAVVVLPLPLAVAALARGRTPRSSSAASPRPSARPGPDETLGRGRARHRLRRRPRPGAGAARRGGHADAVSPSMRAWSDYVAGEIESIAGHAEAAERHYRRAIELARGSGATFLAGVAAVGLLAVQVTDRPHRPRHCTATATSSTTSPAPATGPTCGPRCATWRTCSGASATPIPPRFSTRPRITPPTRRPSTGAIGNSNLRPRP